MQPTGHIHTEDKYEIKAAEWKLLDTANPAFRPVGHAERGKSLFCDYPSRKNESMDDYWKRIRKEIMEKYQ